MRSMKGSVYSLCISDNKGTKKYEVDSARLMEGWGIEGDAHAAQWHRQVSLLSMADFDFMKEIIPSLKPGDFAENIIIQGLNTKHIKTGDKIIISGNVILEVTQIGKECHAGCEIQKLTGRCIMPKRGIFARVNTGGQIKREDSVVWIKDPM
ncbi:MAG: MOSC domain-containing protein [Candidatus Aminicenantes bacterium]|nr:MAG: MOSC domain-containing protein [Candidatus Aminicenantes bacterium]